MGCVTAGLTWQHITDHEYQGAARGLLKRPPGVSQIFTAPDIPTRGVTPQSRKPLDSDDTSHNNENGSNPPFD
ncbi:hypothetical protein NDU88_007456 [Pleurodeles waltl]|uniref:Uncharacterized protein n=1 Tax=Pleurodeles waltl TaxID=8319 RepID=A0AAV7SSP7_PLEWA|nr:hypothetical protein NDU88_007456 [Pleurodeles waltl]